MVWHAGLINQTAEAFNNTKKIWAQNLGMPNKWKFLVFCFSSVHSVWTSLDDSYLVLHFLTQSCSFLPSLTQSYPFSLNLAPLSSVLFILDHSASALLSLALSFSICPNLLHSNPVLIIFVQFLLVLAHTSSILLILAHTNSILLILAHTNSILLILAYTNLILLVLAHTQSCSFLLTLTQSCSFLLTLNLARSCSH